METAERQARMGLCALQVAADPRLAGLVEEHGAEQVWRTILAQPDTALGRRATGVDVQALEDATRHTGTRFVVPEDPLWPAGLTGLALARVGEQGGIPIGLWVAGDLDVVMMPRAVAIVGARAATNYGVHVAQSLAADLSDAGWLVVSGLAFGIDAAAHRGALALGKPTLAYMATGIDATYPAAHQGLRHQIEASGAIVTELAPGVRPLRASFLGRNRLIAAATQGSVVVEAGARSGARNTAAWAAELGRVVMATPGPVTSSQSVTPHHLIREGIATLVASAEHVIDLLSPIGEHDEPPLRGEDRPIDALPEPLRAVREAIPSGEAATVVELMANTGLPLPEVLAAAAELEDLGWVENSPTGWRLPGRR